MITDNVIKLADIQTKPAEVASQRGLALLDQARSVMIKTADDYQGAANLLKQVKDFGAEVEKIRKSITQPLDVARKAVMDIFRKPDSDVAMAKQLLEREMLSYRQEQDRIAREAQAKLQRDADERACKEKAKLEAQAQKAAEKGNTAKAEELKERAQEVEPVVVAVAPVIPQADGLQIKKTWTADVTDLMALVKAIAAGQAPITLVCVSGTELNQFARATKGTQNIPGLKFYQKESTASR